MSNFRILMRNIADEAVTISAAPAFLGTLPVTNLQTQERFRTARTTGVASEVITLTYTSDQRVQMVAVGRHNLTTSSTIRAQLFSDAACTTQIDDSTALAGYSTSGLSQMDLDLYLNAEFRGFKNWAFYFATKRTTVRGIKITITDASNPDVYFDASRLAIGEYFEASYQPPFGGEGVNQQTLTKQTRTDGGSLISDRKADFRGERLDLQWVNATDLPILLSIARRLGKHLDFWFSLYPGLGGAAEIYHQGMYKFTDLGPLEPAMYGIHRQQLNFEEA